MKSELISTDRTMKIIDLLLPAMSPFLFAFAACVQMLMGYWKPAAAFGLLSVVMFLFVIYGTLSKILAKL